jgi:hypothetical protein
MRQIVQRKHDYQCTFVEAKNRSDLKHSFNVEDLFNSTGLTHKIEQSQQIED